MTDQQLSEYFSRFPDRGAFSAVYADMKQPVYTVCLRILGNQEAAEDVCHDVFVKLFTSPPDASLSKPRAWVFRVARNLAIDALRSARYRSCVPLEDADNPISPDWDNRLDLESAICRLPLKEREILTLHLNAGLGFAEIARIREESLPSVYRSYRRALKSMQTLLNGGTI